MLKINTFSASIFEGFGPRFGRVLGWFLEGKMHENRTNMLFAKTWKTLIFLRENWYFQGFEIWKYQKFWQQWHEKLSLFWNINFGWILEGFWEDFGRSKTLIFAFFFDVVSMLKLEGVLKRQRSQKKIVQVINDTHLGPARRNVRGAGERKREGFRSLLGQNSGKKYFLGKHFRCSDRRKQLDCEFSTLVPGGAAERRAQSAGRSSFWPLASEHLPEH